MEVKAESIRFAIDPTDGTTYFTIGVKDAFEARRYVMKHKGKALRVKFSEWREKRSTNANRYCWELLGKLSEKLGIPPEEIYWQMIPDVGGNYTTITVRADAVKELRELWCADHIGRRVDVLGASGPGMVDLRVYKGSSDYDTTQMARLIDLIIEECKQQDIEYLPPDKLAQMLGEWDEKQKDKGPGDPPER